MLGQGQQHGVRWWSVEHGRGRSAVALASAGLVLWTLAAQAQAPPGTLDALRERLLLAQQCYEQVDYRCVIAALEGPLRGRKTLPGGLTQQELVLSHELLGLGYLAVGLEADGREVFRQLVAAQPGYTLQRAEASPQTIAFVARLRDEHDVGMLAKMLAEHVRERAWLVAHLPTARRSAVRVITGMLAAATGRQVTARGRDVVQRIAEPPLGPWQGPQVSVGGALRLFTGSDAEAWDPGLGVTASVEARYRPLHVGVRYAWTRHASILQDAVIADVRPLDVHAISALGGVTWKTSMLAVALDGALGVQLLDASSTTRTANPTTGAEGRIAYAISSGGVVVGAIELMWVWGVRTGRAGEEIAASPSVGFSVGFGYGL